MKKLLAVLMVLVCGGAALSALDLSAGLGGNFNAHFDTYAVSKDGKDAGLKAEDYNAHFVGGGLFAFFDATYVEADVGLLFGNHNNDKTSDMSDEQKKGLDITYLRLALYGKYPISMGNFTLAPMAGIDGLIGLGGKAYGEKVPNDALKLDKFQERVNNFWIRLGASADFNLTEEIYLRPAALYGIRFNTTDEKDTLDLAKDNLSAIVGHGLEIRVAAGYKF
jgi:hypothetical protein